ncbi:MAG TPA: ATP-binding protein, partial [Acidimicrobiales bacterium]|nr:ATP-binding protein [Acidimicrobiales bacterium]
TVRFETVDGVLDVTVRDDGKGLPAGFSIETSDRLGLSIVMRLIESQLGGSISLETDGGTIVSMHVPLKAPSGH